MKRTLYIGLLILCLLASCTQSAETRQGTSLPAAYPELSAVDSLLWQQPDSALTRLIPYFDTCRDVSRNVSATYNRHYAHLLLAELLYKNYYEQTNRAELQQAVGYFDSLCPCADVAFPDARAHYINGVGYYERDSVVEACKEYLTALEVMETHFGEKELTGKKAQFMALANTHLVTLFSDQYLHEQAIGFGKTALKYYRKYDAEAWHVAWLLNTIGGHYEVLENMDIAAFYYKQGLKALSDSSSLMFRDIAISLIRLSYLEGGDPKLTLNLLERFKNKADTDVEYYSRCLSIGEVYYMEGQYDSAWNYLHDVFENTQSQDSKKLAAVRLTQISKTKGKDFEAKEYADFLVPFADKEEMNGLVKSQLTEQYKSYNQRRLEHQYQMEKKENLKWTVGVLTVFLAVLSVFAALYRKSRKKRQRIETQMKEELRSHQIHQKSMSGRLKQKNSEMRKLQEQIRQQAERGDGAGSAASFAEEPVCILVMERVREGCFKSQMDVTLYENYALDKTQVMELRKAADRHFSQFTSRLKKAYPQLTNSDLDYCCLYLLGLTDADVSALMQKAYPTISQRSRKLKAVFGSEMPLSTTLNDFAIDLHSID